MLTAAQLMGEHGVGALPICGEDDRLRGVITDRDIVVKVLARRLDPAAITTAQLAQGTPVTVDARDSAEDVLAAMIAHRVRRLPVTEHGGLVGMIALADVARALDHPQTGMLLQALSSD